LGYFVADLRYEVVPTAPAEEAEGVPAGHIHIEEVSHMSPEVLLSWEGLREVHSPLEEEPLRDHLRVEFVRALSSDGSKHLPLDNGDGVRYVWVWLLQGRSGF
jgi:hypothetical protein